MKGKLLAGLSIGLLISNTAFCGIDLGDGLFTILQKLGAEVMKNPTILKPNDINLSTGSCAAAGLIGAGVMTWQAGPIADKTQIDEQVEKITGFKGKQAIYLAAGGVALYSLSFLSQEGEKIREVLRGIGGLTTIGITGKAALNFFRN